MQTADAISSVSAMLVLLLILLLAWLFSRFLGKSWNSVQAARYMRVIDRMPLGQDRQLLILHLEKEEKHLLLSSSPEGIRVLLELSGEYPEPEGGTGLPRLPKKFEEVLAACRRQGREEKDE